MPLLLLLTLYSFWVIALSVRDPARAFVWLVPLMVVTRSVDTPGIGERIALFDVLLVIWLCLFALRLVVGRATLSVSRETVLVLSLYGLFLGINALSLLDARATTLGVVTLTIYAFGGVICISTVLASRDLGEVKPILISLIVTLLCVTILTLLEAADLHWFLTQRKLSRATSTFRNPNQLGAFIYVALPIAASYLLYASRQHRLLNRVAFVGVVGSCLAVVLTASRFVLLIVAAETGILLFVAGIWLQARTWSRLLQVAGATLSIGVLALSFGIGERHYSNFQVRVLGWAGPLLTSADSEEFFGRASLQSSGSEFMVHNYSLPMQTLLTEPWLGIGVGNASSTYRIGGSPLEVHSQYFAVLARIMQEP